MKLLTLGVLLMLPGLYAGEEVLRKQAVLILPEQIECRLGSSYRLSGKMGFRWDEPEPLQIEVWRSPESRDRSSKPDPLQGVLTVFDENGKELELHYFVSIPSPPDGRETILRGEYRQFGFFIWNGSVAFSRPGHYYAVATFSAWSGKTMVVFNTKKRWFKVVEAPPKKSSL